MKKDNIVENYLRENVSVKLSAKTISERLNIRKKEVNLLSVLIHSKLAH